MNYFLKILLSILIISFYSCSTGKSSVLDNGSKDADTKADLEITDTSDNTELNAKDVKNEVNNENTSEEINNEKDKIDTETDNTALNMELSDIQDEDEIVSGPESSNEGSLPLKSGVGRSSGSGWAKKIRKVEDPDKQLPVSIIDNLNDEKDGIKDISGSDDNKLNASTDTEEGNVDSLQNGADNDRSDNMQDSVPVGVNTAEKDEAAVDSSADENIKAVGKPLQSDDGKTADPEKTDPAKKKTAYKTKAAEYLNTLEDDDKSADLNRETKKKDTAVSSTDKDQVRLAASADKGKSYKSSDAKQDEEKKETGESINRETVVFDDPSHIVVILDGPGWIFTGFTNNDGQITFLSRTVDNGKSVFSFRAGSGDIFILKFQYQNTDGSSRVSEIELIEKSISEDNEKTDKAMGKTEIDEKQIISTENETVSEPVEDDKEAEDLDYNTLFEEALVLIDNGEYEKAADILEKIKDSDFQFPETDYLYYLLGQCYEKNEDKRDPVKAEMYYSMLLDQFPFSFYYEDAEIRKRYLLKYFINIR